MDRVSRQVLICLKRNALEEITSGYIAGKLCLDTAAVERILDGLLHDDFVRTYIDELGNDVWAITDRGRESLDRETDRLVRNGAFVVFACCSFAAFLVFLLSRTPHSEEPSGVQFDSMFGGYTDTALFSRTVEELRTEIDSIKNTYVNYVRSGPDTAVSTVYRVSSRSVNVRSGPSMRYRRVAFAYRNETVEMLKAGKEWSKIRCNGTVGWVRNDMIEQMQE